MFKKPSFILVIIGILFISYATFGTPPAQQSLFDEMTNRSDVVLTGVCTSSTSRWDEQTRMILTDSVFTVQSYVKGRGKTAVSVTTPGGVLRAQNLMMTFPGMIEFAPGEEALLFLTTNREGAFEVYGRVSGTKQIQQVQRLIQQVN